MEYIGLNPAQQLYSKRNLLYCEMEMLNTIKNYQLYKKYRKEEIALKKLLKKKILEIQDHVTELCRHMPHVHIEKPKPIEVPRAPAPAKPRLPPEPKRDKLDEEIFNIKRRLAALQNE
jgi:hypothetical protein